MAGDRSTSLLGSSWRRMVVVSTIATVTVGLAVGDDGQDLGEATPEQRGQCLEAFSRQPARFKELSAVIIKELNWDIVQRNGDFDLCIGDGHRFLFTLFFYSHWRTASTTSDFGVCVPRACHDSTLAHELLPNYMFFQWFDFHTDYLPDGSYDFERSIKFSMSFKEFAHGISTTALWESALPGLLLVFLPVLLATLLDESLLLVGSARTTFQQLRVCSSVAGLVDGKDATALAEATEATAAFLHPPAPTCASSTWWSSTTASTLAMSRLLLEAFSLRRNLVALLAPPKRGEALDLSRFRVTLTASLLLLHVTQGSKWHEVGLLETRHPLLLVVRPLALVNDAFLLLSAYLCVVGHHKASVVAVTAVVEAAGEANADVVTRAKADEQQQSGEEVKATKVTGSEKRLLLAKEGSKEKEEAKKSWCAVGFGSRAGKLERKAPVRALTGSAPVAAAAAATAAAIAASETVQPPPLSIPPARPSRWWRCLLQQARRVLRGLTRAVQKYVRQLPLCLFWAWVYTRVMPCVSFNPFNHSYPWFGVKWFKQQGSCMHHMFRYSFLLGDLAHFIFGDDRNAWRKFYGNPCANLWNFQFEIEVFTVTACVLALPDLLGGALLVAVVAVATSKLPHGRGLWFFYHARGVAVLLLALRALGMPHPDNAVPTRRRVALMPGFVLVFAALVTHGIALDNWFEDLVPSIAKMVSENPFVSVPVYQTFLAVGIALVGEGCRARPTSNTKGSDVQWWTVLARLSFGVNVAHLFVQFCVESHASLQDRVFSPFSWITQVGGIASLSTAAAAGAFVLVQRPWALVLAAFLEAILGWLSRQTSRPRSRSDRPMPPANTERSVGGS
eukprot:TRINITY_DN40602_c0_g1_i1.p1 TRINITY_DN40602_c0_g1~~TRINITY_DN40602_c0_g1_i1.p1  ORF type:complete len:894 (+),score=135.71 TRINITY_DN40602_c0_g1_i1:149-2683(+)